MDLGRFDETSVKGFLFLVSANNVSDDKTVLIDQIKILSVVIYKLIYVFNGYKIFVELSL
jgi:hypothetical protein